MSGQAGDHWLPGGRAALPALLARDWDLLIIGGGVTGAGILLEASRRGLTALLVEQRDFAWGTSSRSSKLVHGGLRYLKEGQLALTRESVRERDRLLREAPGLVEPQSFAFGDYAGRKPGRRMFLVGLALYDGLAGRGWRWNGRHYRNRDTFLSMAPNLSPAGLRGGMVYDDAKTDDARLVLRLLHEARAHGGVAVNYLAAQTLLRDGEQLREQVPEQAREQAREQVQPQAPEQVRGALLHDSATGQQHTVRARLVINASGAWADSVSGLPGAQDKGDKGGKAKPRLRPLRGSHLVLPAWRLPLAQAISLMHPADGRPVFAYPWEGVTLVGTTDVDHAGDLAHEASITRAECDYLMAALHDQFPQLGLTDADIIASYAGVRPVIEHGADIGSGRGDRARQSRDQAPSRQSRDHAVWIENGMLTVTGGKLTTFRVIALDALAQAQAAALLPGWRADLVPRPVFTAPPPLRHDHRLAPGQAARLAGRYGAHAQALVDAAHDGELRLIAGSATIWAQLRWAARCEAVLRLDDLLLRRTRLGLQLRGGGIDILPRVRAICQPELGWDDARWDAEQAAYLALWQRHYSLPAA